MWVCMSVYSYEVQFWFNIIVRTFWLVLTNWIGCLRVKTWFMVRVRNLVVMVKVEALTALCTNKQEICVGEDLMMFLLSLSFRMCPMTLCVCACQHESEREGKRASAVRRGRVNKWMSICEEIFHPFWKRISHYVVISVYFVVVVGNKTT